MASPSIGAETANQIKQKSNAPHHREGRPMSGKAKHFDFQVPLATIHQLNTHNHNSHGSHDIKKEKM